MNYDFGTSAMALLALFDQFSENRHKCFCMNHLHQKASFANQAQSSLIKPNRLIIVNKFGRQSIAPNHHHFGMN
jgi:hypothetical protein